MNARDVIEKFCEINERVAKHMGNAHNSQCFCGACWNGGLVPGVEKEGLEENGYRHTGETLQFINQAITAKILRAENQEIVGLRRQNLEHYNAVRDAQRQRDTAIKARDSAFLERDAAVAQRNKAQAQQADESAKEQIIEELRGVARQYLGQREDLTYQLRQLRDELSVCCQGNRALRKTIIEEVAELCIERNGFFASYAAAEHFVGLLRGRFLVDLTDESNAAQRQNSVPE